MKSHDPKQESKHIIYLDAKKLYSYAMSKFLPASGFKQMNMNKHIQYTEYSKEIHELHSGYP